MAFTGFTRWIFIIFAGTVVTSLTASCAEASPTDTGSTSVRIEYQRSGGFAGFDDRLTIDAERKVVIVRKGKQVESVLDQESFEELLQQLDQIGFAELEKEYLPADTCCDLIEHTITYQDHTVRTMTTAVPGSLQPLLDLLNAIIESETSSLTTLRAGRRLQATTN